jgi:hypothetical protein
MTRTFRMLLLGAASLLALAFAGVAAAAFNPTLAIGQTPPTAGSTATSFRLTVPRDDDALFRALFYIPTGYTATLGQASGTQIGTVAAQVQVREPIAGAVLPLTGTVVVTNVATVGTAVAQCTGTPTHAGYWVLVLQAAGQELRVPMVVDPVAGPLAAAASYVLSVCLPSPHIPVAAGGATFGAKLIQAQVNLTNVLRAPSSGGTYRWHAVTTPWPNGPGLPNAAGTVTAQGTIGLPGAISLSATSKKRVLTVTGRLTEGGQGIGARTVTVRIGTKNFSVRTNTAGTFRKTLRIAKGSRVAVRATAAVPARTGACSATSPFAPIPCVSDTSQFFTATRSIIARVR